MTDLGRSVGMTGLGRYAEMTGSGCSVGMTNLKRYVEIAGLGRPVGMKYLERPVGMPDLERPVGMTDSKRSRMTNLAPTPDHRSMPAPNPATHEVPQRSSQNPVSAHDADL